MKAAELLWRPVCPCCGKNMDALARVDRGEPVLPNPGDFSVCFYCSETLIFGKELELVKVTLDQLSDFKRRDIIGYLNLELTVQAIKKHNQQKN